MIGHRDYVLSTYQKNFTYAGMREPHLHTDHSMVPEVLHGEGTTGNRRY